MLEQSPSAWAKALDDAALARTQIDKITGTENGMTMDDGYEIQRALVARYVDRGDTIVGRKMGLTSRAKMEQMGVHEPIHGVITRAMHISDGDAVDPKRFGQPRVEPELALFLDRDLCGPTTPAEAARAVGGVCAALEIIDSRYANFSFTLADVVADNASAAGFVLGPRVRHLSDVEISNLGMVMEIDGLAVGIGSSAAILDHPLRSLAALANLVYPATLPAGTIVLAGGATAAVAIKPGQRVTLRVAELGMTQFQLLEMM